LGDYLDASPVPAGLNSRFYRHHPAELHVPEKTALITGAAGSLGSELSRQLAQRGWNVVMLDKDRRGLERAWDTIAEDVAGVPALYPLDLAALDPEMCETLFETIEQEFEGLDAVVHAAAHFENLAPVEHVLPQDWLMHMQVNLNAPWLLSAMALPLLRQSQGGKLLFLLEDLEKVEGALWGAYGVSKHAVRTLVNQLALECRSSQVEVRGVNPGPMRSAIRAKAYHAENPAHMTPPEFSATRIAAYLEGRVQWPDVFVDLVKRNET
jgi:NAD(P)-dependent dehydrogenase (short-subunit alcohol dehydrogenase family)